VFVKKNRGLQGSGAEKKPRKSAVALGPEKKERGKTAFLNSVAKRKKKKPQTSTKSRDVE